MEQNVNVLAALEMQQLITNGADARYLILAAQDALEVRVVWTAGAHRK